MPLHDHASRRSNAERVQREQARAMVRAMEARFKKPGSKRKRPEDDGGEGVPVEPNRPNNLTGGAAAALEFDD
jgi:hypothetical protein